MLVDSGQAVLSTVQVGERSYPNLIFGGDLMAID